MFRVITDHCVRLLLYDNSGPIGALQRETGWSAGRPNRPRDHGRPPRYARAMTLADHA